LKFNRDKHHRRSIRLKDYDYTNPGVYFVTICTWNRECLFGDIVNGGMQLNDFGEIVIREWRYTGDIRRTNVELDEFVIMPNHVHGILTIISGNGCRGMARHAPTVRQFANPVAQSLSSIIGSFKSAVTRQINISRNHPGMPVWQRNYYEHIIRNETEMDRIRQYIIHNPSQWDNDENNPANYMMTDL
jgi:putative transposase